MKKLIAYLKKLKFKVGLYSSAGEYTCKNAKCKSEKERNPGSYEFEDNDAKLFV